MGRRFGNVEVNDRLIHGALKEAIATSGRISKAEVQLILESTYDKGGLSWAEAEDLRRVARQSTKLTQDARRALTEFVESVEGELKGMPDPEKVPDEGWAFLGDTNFAGKGWKKNATFRIRPRNYFDLAAKLHDLHYELNGIEFSPVPQKEMAESRQVKADRIFAIMNRHMKPRDQSTRTLNALSKTVFKGDFVDRMRKGDGFVNALIEPKVMVRLCNPALYLMIPYDALPADERSVTVRVRKRTGAPRGTVHSLPGAAAGAIQIDEWYYKSVPYDHSPGLWSWLKDTYRGVWGRLIGITKDTGPRPRVRPSKFGGPIGHFNR